MINLMAVVSPDPFGVYEEFYNKGELIVPKIVGKYTVFSILPAFDSDSLGTYQEEEQAGANAQRDTQVVWLAADTVAQAEARKRNGPAIARMQAQSQLAVPGQGLIR